MSKFTLLQAVKDDDFINFTKRIANDDTGIQDLCDSIDQAFREKKTKYVDYLLNIGKITLRTMLEDLHEWYPKYDSFLFEYYASKMVELGRPADDYDEDPLFLAIIRTDGDFRLAEAIISKGTWRDDTPHYVVRYAIEHKDYEMLGFLAKHNMLSEDNIKESKKLMPCGGWYGKYD